MSSTPPPENAGQPAPPPPGRQNSNWIFGIAVAAFLVIGGVVYLNIQTDTAVTSCSLTGTLCGTHGNVCSKGSQSGHQGCFYNQNSGGHSACDPCS